LPITPTAVTAVASDGSSLAYAALFGQSFSVKGLYKSTDGGLTWTQRQALNVDIERLAANGNNVLAGDLFGAYYSTDFGESWAFSDPGNCPQGCGIFTYTIKGNSIFAGNTEGMFESTDSGATWTQIDQNFPTCPIPVVEASCADDSFLFAGTTGEAVWRKQLAPQTLQLTTAVSRKTHGTAGTFDIDVLNANLGPECRSSGGNHTLVFTFTNSVTSGSASVTSGTGNVSGSPGFSGNTMTVNLTSVADEQKITVTLSNVTDTFAQVLPNTAVDVNMLVGDITGSKTVNASDVSLTKSRAGSLVDATTFRADVNTSGSINASDVSLVKSKSGNAVP
jgi:hypothetical protein